MTRREGWRLVAWAALVVVLMTGAILAAHGFTEPGTRAVIRGTARTSFVLFLCAFLAPVFRRHPSLADAQPWLLVALAFSHLVHAAAIVANIALTPPHLVERTPQVELAGGLAGYAIIFALALTSFERPAALIGPRGRAALLSPGMYVIWSIFAVSYIGRTVDSLAFAPFTIALLAALALRISGARGAPQFSALSAATGSNPITRRAGR